MTDCDVAIIGAGHNGLTCAAYLARAGLKVIVLESRDTVGGAAVTTEFVEGFRNSTLSWSVSMLSPRVMRDLELEKHGLELLPRAPGVLSALPGGRHMIIGGDDKTTQAEIAKFSKRDSERHPEFLAELRRLASLLRELAEERPPNIGGGVREVWNWIKTGNRLRKLPREVKEKLVTLMTAPLGDYLDGWFESDEVKGFYAGEASCGNFVHPYAAGSAFVLLHQAMGAVKGEPGSRWHAKGGMGAITQAMAKSAEAAGAEIRTNAPVRSVLTTTGTEGGAAAVKVRGVVLEDETEITARMVAANCTPKLLFTKLVDAALLPKPFHVRMKNWRCASGTLRMSVALAELPQITSLKGAEDIEKQMQRPINISPSPFYMEKAWQDARVHGTARQPFVSMFIPSLLDDTLAPDGQHVAGLFCQHFNPELADGMDWDHLKDEAADHVIEAVTEIAPNFRDAILGMEVISPKDMETQYGLTGGDIYHGAMHADQLFSLRPAAGYADYRTPLKNLYLCGAGAHPGGGVTGTPGRLAAKEIIRDA